MSEPASGSAAQLIEAYEPAMLGLLVEAPWPLALVTANGHILAFSAPLRDLLGTPAETLLDRPFESLFLDEEQARLRALLERGVRAPIRAHLRQPGRVPVAVEIEAIPLPDDTAGRISINIYPHTTPHRRERMILELNLLASNLLTAQSAEQIYRQAMHALRPLGIGMLVTVLEPDEAALRIEYTSIGSSTLDLLRRAANVDMAQLRIASTTPLIAAALARGQMIFGSDITPIINAALPATAAAICRNLLRLVGGSGCILAPLQADRPSNGILIVWGQLLNREDGPFIGAFAYQIGAILAQITLRRKLEMQVQRLNSLATTARAVTTLGSLDEVLRIICVQAQELLGATLAWIAVPVAGTTTIKYIMSTGMAASGLMNLLLPIETSVSGVVLRSGQGRLINDLQTDPEIHPSVKELSTARSVLYQPLHHQGMQLGVLIVGSDKVGKFDQADLDYLGRYAEYAAVAIANAHLHAALQQSERDQQRQSRELSALLDLSQAVNQSLDLDIVLHEGLRVLDTLELATVATVMLVNSDTKAFELHAARGVPATVLPAIQRSSLNTIVGDVLQAEQLRVLSQTERQRMLDQYGITKHFRHQISVYIPLIVSQQRLGVLGVSRPDDRPYAERDLWLLQALANNLAQATAKAQAHHALQATAAQNAQLYREAEEVRSYLNTLIHTTPDLLISIKPDMTLHLLNPERIATTGMHYPELMEGRSFLDIIPADRHADILVSWRQILAGFPQSLEITGNRADGSPYTALLSAALIADYGEVFVIVKDVTVQRHSEMQVRQNEKLAALGRMVAGTAHELNNPLAAILGLAQIQLLGELALDVRADIERIERSALRARAIVQQLLTFARTQRPNPLGQTIQLAITDSGPGIAPAHIAQIFEPFFTTRTVGQGTGLGLAISHTIIQQHQGQISVTSSAGQTTFTIELPRAEEPPHEAAPIAPLAPLAIYRRILLVEDEEMVRSVITRTLTRHNYHVDAVGSGAAALELALAHDYALIISDLQMPQMDGPELYERLSKARPALRWLIITGDTMGERSHAFLENTRLQALPKPFTREQLLAQVAACIGDLSDE